MSLELSAQLPQLNVSGLMKRGMSSRASALRWPTSYYSLLGGGGGGRSTKPLGRKNLLWFTVCSQLNNLNLSENYI